MAKLNKHQQAGHIRASSSLRDTKGRFTTNLFKREVLKTVAAKKGFDVSKDERQKDKAIIDEVIKKAKITNAELNKEYKQNIEMFSDMLENGWQTTTSKNFNQVENDIDNYKGKFVVSRNGERINISKTELKMELKKFKQFLSSTVNASDYSQKLKLTFDGKMIIQLPDVKQIRKKYKEQIDELSDSQDSEMFSDFIDELTNEFDDPDDITIYGS